MPNEDSNKKLAPLLILKILQEYSDVDHPLKREDILAHLKNDYPDLHVSVQRKAISATLQLLSTAGYDINFGQHYRGVWLGERALTNYQVQYLTDAVYSSKNISKKDSDDLVESISSCLSSYERKSLKGLYKSVDVNKTTRRNLFLNLEQMQEAINQKRKIKFQYFTYNENLKRVPRYNDQYYYEVSPYYLVNNFGKCYLLCGNDKYRKLSVFRIDNIENLEIEKTKRTELKNLNPEKYKDFTISSYINSHVYLFSDEVTEARLIVKNASAINDIYDWFGKNARLETKDNVIYANITSDEHALYYWLLQYGDNVELMEPEDLLIRLANTYKTMYERYRDVFSTHDVKPDLVSQIDTYLRHCLDRQTNALSDSNALAVSLTDFLNDVNTSNYKATAKVKGLSNKPLDILIRNSKDINENYVLSVLLLDEVDTTKGVYNIIKELSFLEQMASKSMQCHLIVLTGNKNYVRKTLSENDLTNMLSLRHCIPKGKISYLNEAVTLNHSYPIVWHGITQLKTAENDNYNYFMVEIKK